MVFCLPQHWIREKVLISKAFENKLMQDMRSVVPGNGQMTLHVVLSRQFHHKIGQSL